MSIIDVSGKRKGRGDEGVPLGQVWCYETFLLFLLLRLASLFLRRALAIALVIHGVGACEPAEYIVRSVSCWLLGWEARRAFLSPGLSVIFLPPFLVLYDVYTEVNAAIADYLIRSTYCVFIVIGAAE